MDARRKNAYRFLLFWAMLRIRQVAWQQGTWKPWRWKRYRCERETAGYIADMLHNLALVSARDFTDFDEDRFWADCACYARQYPESNLDEFRTIFEQELAK